MKNLIGFKLFKIVFIGVLVLSFANCNNKRGKFEFILDEYIAHNSIDKADHYLLVNTNKWTDSTSIIIIKYKYLAKDKLKLPEIALKSSYKGIDIYFVGTNPFPVSNGLYYETIIKRIEEEKLEAYNEYFNDVQIVYYPNNDCFLDIISHNKNSEYFRKYFKDKGLICE